MKKTNANICYMARFSTSTSSGWLIRDSKLELQQALMAQGFITFDFRPLKSVNCAKVERHGKYAVVLKVWDYGMPDDFRF